MRGKMRGLYQRGKKGIWWIRYYEGKVEHRESSKSTDIKVARRLLKLREGKIAEGRLPGVLFDRVTLEDLAKMLIADYRRKGNKTVAKTERFGKYLMEGFQKLGVTLAVEVTTEKVEKYVEMRLNEPLPRPSLKRGPDDMQISQQRSRSSVNRELAALKRMFHLGMQCTPPKVQSIPHIPISREDNARQGFFEYHEFEALRDALPHHLQSLVTFAYLTGWRTSEIQTLKWDAVDTDRWTVTLKAEFSKNKTARAFPLTGELREIFQALHAEHLEKYPDCPFVFHHEGKRIKDFRGSWEQACLKAGLYEIVVDKNGYKIKKPSKTVHDFHRTAIRGMTRARVPRSIAMQISGHRTESVYRRYDITDAEDLRDASGLIDASFKRQEEKCKVIPFPGKAVNES